jgi:aminopeptidase YwaD
MKPSAGRGFSRAVAAMSLLLCVPALSAQQTPDIESRVRAELAAARALSPALVKAVQPVIDSAWSGFGEAEAMRTVELASRYWRLPGNEGYNVTLDRVHARLTTSAATWVETALGPSPGWDHTVGTLSLLREGQSPLTVLSKERERLALAINSYSTNGPVDAPLVDVGGGQATDFEGKDVKGAVVIGDADLGGLFRQAVVQRGAIGVISTSIARYIADDPDILQWGSIPRDAERKAFGFKASRRANETLRAALKSGPQRVRVEVASTFAEKPERTLVHEIKGRTLPNERIVIAAHLQEPGANDNASGVATLQEMAVALTRAIESGAVARPARTITFLWLNEISGSRSWLQRHADQVPGVKYMFSMDMTGQDVTKTGGSFLVERWPDPGAIWSRPWDPNSEWGRGNVRKESLKGDLLNDLHLAVCERVAQKTGWVVKTNPYEGGSDHTVFGTAGIPSLLNWHFTDRYYHTNMDTPDKTSAAEMRNVGVAVATSAWLLASADQTLSLEVAELVARAGRARIAVEQRDGASLADHADALAAWRAWSAEAVRSVSRLVTGPAAPDLSERLESLAAPLVSEGARGPSNGAQGLQPLCCPGG